MKQKQIAVITGASSGIGKEFAVQLKSFGKFDEVWVIARRLDRLEALTEEIPFPIKPIALELSKAESFTEYEKLLETEKPAVKLLINCSGFGIFDSVVDTPIEKNLNMIDLNCKAVVGMCQTTIPYMPKNSNIINVSSISSYQPVPFVNIYAATKVFVKQFSRALVYEVRKQKIKVTAVTPYWTKTEFFNRAVDPNDDPVVKKYAVMYEPKKVVKQAYKDARKGKQVSMYGFQTRATIALAYILPDRAIMLYWMTQQKLWNRGIRKLEK